MQGIRALVSSSDSFEVKMASCRAAKPSKQGYIGTFPETEPMLEVTVHTAERGLEEEYMTMQGSVNVGPELQMGKSLRV